MPNVEVKEKLWEFQGLGFKRRTRYVSLYAWESVTKGFRVSVKKDRAGFLMNGFGWVGLKRGSDFALLA